MADTSRIPGAFKSKFGWLKELGRTTLSAVVVLIIIVLGYFTWRHYSQSHKKGTQLAGPSQVENIDKKSTDSFLKNKDLTSYQISQQSLAQQYLLNKDPANAERVIKETLANVPMDKVTSGTYMVIADAEKAKSDKGQYKYYLGLLIAKLKQEGKAILAAEYQTELSKQ